jgi:hypothetical protein
LDAAALAWGAAASDASSAAELRQVVAAGAESAPGNADTATVLTALTFLCDTQTGAARVVAAGLLPQVVRLLRSPNHAVAYAAAALCQGAAKVDASARAALARDAVPALLPLLRLAPPCRLDDDFTGVKSPAVVANLLGLLAMPESGATAPAARTGGVLAGAGGSTVTAAVLASGGVARTVELLRAALGGGGHSLNVWSALRLLWALAAFASTHPAATAAARAAGVLPLATRAIVAAQRTPGAGAKALLTEGLCSVARFAAAGDLPALAGQPDLIRALAGAVTLAADGASEGWSAVEAERLGHWASDFVAQLLAKGRPDATAKAFLAADGAAHLVRRPTRVSVSAGRARWAGGLQRGVYACGAGTVPHFGWLTAAVVDARAPAPHGLAPNHSNFPHPFQSSHRCGFCPPPAHAALGVRTSSSPYAPWRRSLRAAVPFWRPARRPPSGPRLRRRRRQAAPAAAKCKEPAPSRSTPAPRSRHSRACLASGCECRWLSCRAG